jgi:EAL domain-containing protein (putative c-di-GMP-specific phosphodiesterase class I)
MDLAACLASYGLDDRARSALRAFARFADRGEGLAASVDLLLEDLDPVPHKRGGEPHHRRFVELLVQLADRDFEKRWLDETARAWAGLTELGYPPDFPMRAVRRMVAGQLALLDRGRDQYSRLDAEIALSLGTAGLCLCGLLTAAGCAPDTARRGAGRIVEPESSAAARQPELLASVLELGNDGLVGLVAGLIESGGAAASLDDNSLARIYAHALARVRQCLRAKDILVRTGRSGFTVILPGLKNRGQLQLAASKIASAFDAPFGDGGRGSRLGIRIGVAWAPDHGSDADALLRGARLAAHQAGRVGRRIEFFDSGILEQAEREAEIERDLSLALDSGSLSLHLQPQLQLSTGRCTGAEALLRWQDSRGLYVPPPQTFDIAERIGLGPQLTRWIVHHACRLLAGLNRSGIELRLSVNLTAADIADPDLPLTVSNAIELWHVKAQDLTFELTESAMLSNDSISAQVMKALCDLGAHTSIDDFGTGYSSVLYLKTLPVDELKIDQVFVTNLATVEQDREIVRSLIDLAHSLHLDVVAEGVENAATLALLREYGCDRVQGYLIARPLPIQQFADWWAAHQLTAKG